MKIRASDGRGLFVRLSSQEVDPEQPLVLVMHGYGEHSGRYAHFASALERQGIQMLSFDFRGHGQSEGQRGAVLQFEEFYNDLRAVSEWLDARHQGPLFWFAHSHGALVTCDYLLKNTDPSLNSKCSHRLPKGVILTSPLLGVAVPIPKVKEMAGRLLSKILPRISMPSGIPPELVCRDRVFSDAYAKDPLNNSVGNVRWFTEMTKACERVLEAGHRFPLPVFFLYAGTDHIVDANTNRRFGELLKQGAKDSTGTKDVKVEFLKEAYHEIVNEPPEVRERVFEEISAWIKTRL